MKLLTLGAVAALGGCSRTVYDLFPGGSGDPVGSGGGCALNDCGEGDTEPYGDGDGDSSVDPTGLPGGATGEGTDLCKPAILTGRTLQMLRFKQSGNCVRQGEPTLIGNDPAYLVVTGECNQEHEAAWVTLPDPYSALQFRNEASALNLDVRLAASASGTPLVLYQPHALYNQRFLPILKDNTGFLLSPRHAEQQCLTEVAGGVEIWPCNATLATQRLELIDCVDLTP